MRILVTGGAGFIGSHIVERYLALGHQVAVVDNLSTGRRDFVGPGARFHQVDICSPALEEVFASFRPQVVNHHAAQISVSLSVRDPLLDARVNVLGTLRLLELCRKYGVEKVIFASSGGTVYGEPLYLPVREDHPCRPANPYGASKLAGELYLQAYHQAHGLRYTALRYGNVYGPRQFPHGEAGVVAIFALKMLRGERPVIYGSGEQERDFVFVEDVVQANVLALERGDNRAVNIGTGRGTSVNRIFSLLRGITGYDGEAEYAPPRPGEVFRIALEPSLAGEALGWHPSTPLEEGLSLTVSYFQREAPNQREE